MSQPRARIASQLGLALAVILAVVISGSTVFALRSLDSANLDTREEHLASEARLLADQLNTFHSTLRESTQRLSGLFEKRFGSGLSVRSEELVKVGSVQAPGLYLGNELLKTTSPRWTSSSRCPRVSRRCSCVAARISSGSAL